MSGNQAAGVTVVVGIIVATVVLTARVSYRFGVEDGELRTKTERAKQSMAETSAVLERIQEAQDEDEATMFKMGCWRVGPRFGSWNCDAGVWPVADPAGRGK